MLLEWIGKILQACLLPWVYILYIYPHYLYSHVKWKRCLGVPVRKPQCCLFWLLCLCHWRTFYLSRFWWLLLNSYFSFFLCLAFCVILLALAPVYAWLTQKAPWLVFCSLCGSCSDLDVDCWVLLINTNQHTIKKTSGILIRLRVLGQIQFYILCKQ